MSSYQSSLPKRMAPLQERKKTNSYNGVPLGAHYLDVIIQIGP